jgi:hypothetical protein
MNNLKFNKHINSRAHISTKEYILNGYDVFLDDYSFLLNSKGNHIDSLGRLNLTKDSTLFFREVIEDTNDDG